MAIIITPNMNLPVPVVGQELGPQYATDVNNCFTQLDGHNHTPGYGVQIPPSGLNINSDLTFMNNRAINVKSAQFFVQGSPLAAVSPDLGAVYVSGVDLYYNDVNGNQIRITQGGSVNSGSGSISGLVSPASASYSSLSQTFVWQSNVNTSASMDNGPVTIRENIANAKGITIQSPASLPNDYSITLLPALPASNKLLQIDPSGNLSATNDPPTYQLSLLGTSTTFTSDGDFIVPTGVNYVRIVAVGGGGGGAGGGNAVFNSQHGSGGGGGGQMFEGVVAVTPGDTIHVTIGGGGNGGATNANPTGARGSPGANTTFGSIVTILGGNGGEQGSATGGPGQPGTHAGGDGTTGTTAGTSQIPAGDGYLVVRQTGSGGGGAQVTNGDGGGGGGAYGAGGDGGANAPASTDGISAADNTGGGGGGGVGGSAGGAGGNGGSGILIVYIQ